MIFDVGKTLFQEILVVKLVMTALFSTVDLEDTAHMSLNKALAQHLLNRLMQLLLFHHCCVPSVFLDCWTKGSVLGDA